MLGGMRQRTWDRERGWSRTGRKQKTLNNLVAYWRRTECWRCLQVRQAILVVFLIDIDQIPQIKGVEFRGHELAGREGHDKFDHWMHEAAVNGWGVGGHCSEAVSWKLKGADAVSWQNHNLGFRVRKMGL